MKVLSFLGAVLVAAILLIFVSSWGMDNLRQAFCSGSTEKIIQTVVVVGATYIFTLVLFFAFYILVILKRSREPVSMVVVSILVALIGVGGVIYYSFKISQETCASPDIYQSLAPVCQGIGVSNAGKYQAGSSAQHIVILYMDGSMHPWSAIISRKWKPQSIGDTQLVACISKPTNILAEPCEGLANRNITRYREEIHVNLVDPQSAEIIASDTFTGELPSCDGLDRNLMTEIIGKVELETVETWISSILPAKIIEDTMIPSEVPTKLPTHTVVTPTPTLKPTQPPPTATQVLMAMVKSGTVRVRKGPGTEFGLVGGMTADMQVPILGRNAAMDWIKIVLPDGKQGWVFADLVKIPVPIGNLPELNE